MTTNSLGALNAYREAIQRLADTPGNSAPQKMSQSDFSTMVRNAAESAVEVGQKAEQQTAAAAAGKADLNSVVMAVAEAELTLSTAVSIRDKVIEAYREILRMPI